MCKCKHHGNLLKRAVAVNLEKRLTDSNIRPDLWLSTNGVKPCTLIEVVDSHAPEPHTKAWAESSNVPLLEFHVKNPDDLEKIRKGDLYPTSVMMSPVCLCRRGMTDRQWCLICNDCFRAGHSHCRRCQRVECSGTLHKWCDSCRPGQCDEGGGTHRHCQNCGDLMFPNAARKYRLCFCCYMTDKFNSPRCWQRQQINHSHCRQCGRSIKTQYEHCWTCNRALTAKAYEEHAKQLAAREQRWRNADRTEREAMLAERR